MTSESCRICLETDRGLETIFQIRLSVDVPTFIKEISAVSVVKNDGFPSNICRRCLAKLQAAHEFRSQCIDSDQKLRSQSLSNATLQDRIQTIKDEDELIINPPLKFEELTTSDHLQIEHDETKPKIRLTQSKRKRQPSLPKSHMCSVCGMTFSTTGHLNSHEQIHNEVKDFPCDFCGKKFLTKSYLNRHMKSHANKRNHVCQICQKGFNTTTSLKYHHRLVHSGETNFVCSFCKKGFPLKIQLISHIRSHSGEKPFSCNQCDKKYSHKIDLKRHLMLHSGIKPFKCPYCERTFTKKSNMECHIPIHTGEMPYKCKICFKEFRQPCPFKKHLQAHLKDEPMEVTKLLDAESANPANLLSYEKNNLISSS